MVCVWLHLVLCCEHAHSHDFIWLLLVAFTVSHSIAGRCLPCSSVVHSSSIDAILTTETNLRTCTSTLLFRLPWSWTVLLPRETKKKFLGLCPRANYTDRATAACRRSDRQIFADRRCHVVDVTSLPPYSRFSRQELLLFYQVAPQLYSRGWVDPVPDALHFFW
jgi:hypothetical protein